MGSNTRDNLAELAVELADTPYHPVARLGQGAMGAVYEVVHRTLNRKLVVKVLREPNRPDLEDRLRLEAQALAQLSHPNVLAVVDYAKSASGQPFIVSERLYGQTLKAHVGPTGALPVGEAVRYVQQTLLGLSVAHKAGIVHRDIKLDNLFLTAGDESNPPRVVVIDFGIAKLVGAEGVAAPVAPLENPTAEGIMVGTPSFMSPEQVSNLKVDHRADIYGAGVVLYRLLAGRAPFICKDLLEYATAHATEIPLPPSRFAVLPAGLDAVVLRALEKAPQKRFAAAKEMIEALAPFATASGPVAVASAVVHGPDSLPTAPLPDAPRLQQPAAPLAARGTELMMEAPPTRLSLANEPAVAKASDPNRFAAGGTQLALDSPPGGQARAQSPERGTEVYLGPSPAHGAPVARTMAMAEIERVAEPSGRASGAGGSAPSFIEAPVSGRRVGLSGVEKAALLVALLAGAAILWFSVSLLTAG